MIQQVAGALGLEVLRSAPGGEFGAVHVTDAAGGRLILKVTDWPGAEADWTRGARLAETLRGPGYPAPRYEGVGTVGEVTWSLQSVLPGELPAIMTAAHAEQLVELASSHAGRSPEAEPGWATDLRARSVLGCQWLSEQPRTRAWGEELGALLESLDVGTLGGADIVHNDFHHRNYLCDAEAVTGIFDWEGAVAGDWRFDLATLTFWSWLAQDQVSADAREACLRQLDRLCDPPTKAFLGACISVRVIGFYEAVRPDTLPPKLAIIDKDLAPWWR